MVLEYAEKLDIAKSFELRQPARNAQADVGWNLLAKCIKLPFSQNMAKYFHS